MIIDTSAIIAVLFNESDARIYAEAIVKSENCRISAATFLETAIVIEAQTENAGIQQFDAFIRRAGIIVEPVTQDQAQIARQAYSDFGKGRHPAGLNFGDCFSYAFSKASGEPVLFKGGDFGKTDIGSAV